jgi:hypothetical protein
MMLHQRCRLILLFLFLVYAVSPLTWNFIAGPRPAAPDAGAPARSVSSATLYLLDLLYAAVSGSEEHDQDVPENRILLKKKWAVHRGSNIVSRPAPAIQQLSAAAAPCPAGAIAAGTAGWARPWPKKPDAYLPLSSGLSPPLLS